MGGEGKKDAGARAGAHRVQDPGRARAHRDGEAEQDGPPVHDTAGPDRPEAGEPRPGEGVSAPGAADGSTPESAEGAQGSEGAERSESAGEGADGDGAERPEAPAGEPAPDATAQEAPARHPAQAEPAQGAAPTGTPAPDAADGPMKRVSRRFPALTRDTARPEGGGRAVGGDAPAPVRQWPMLVVTGGVAVGLLLVALDVFRGGALVIGLSLLAGAALRRLLPVVGMLAVRSRFTDMVIYGVLGVLIILLALMAQPRPWLEIPFLDDIVHFTVR